MAWNDIQQHSLSVVSPVVRAVDVLHVVVQGKDVGVDVRAFCPGEPVAVPGASNGGKEGKHES